MNFIIYEDNKEYIENYKKIIFKLMSESNIDYKTMEVLKWSNGILKDISTLDGNKIYILDIEVKGKNGIDLAREIRNNGDWVSPIIIVTSHEEFKLVGYTAKILMLDFITKTEDLDKSLYSTLDLALKIVSQNKKLMVKSRNSLKSIHYDEILYIEKNLNDNYSVVYTSNDNYTIRKSISVLDSELDGKVFYRSHRSCIVNLNNIKRVDFDKGIIEFVNCKIDLLSRAKKKGLKTKLENLS